jgi:O-antigen/teichoic acid export membrane protein
MSGLKRNIVANFVGKIWSAGLTFLLIPFYIKYLGIESYGLIGFYSTLLASFGIIDQGLTTTLNRELARSKAIKKDSKHIRDLVFTLESIYWIVSLFISLIIMLLSPTISTHWIKSQVLNKDVINHAVILMGVVLAFQAPIGMYIGGLLGLEKQVTLNVILIITSTIRSAGVLLAFIWFKPTIEVFFIWQAASCLFQVLIMRIALWRFLPKYPGRAIFSIEQLRYIGKFALGMTGVGLVGFFLSQIDKVVLSKLLPLKEYGFYILAFNVTSILSLFVAPISYAVFPKFSSYISLKQNNELKKVYDNASRLVTTIICPIALFLLFFSSDILVLWTKNIEAAKATTQILRLMSIATLLNCLINIPTMLLMANGNTKYILIQNTIAAFIFLPLLLWFAPRYGGSGAALIWLLLNVAYLIISVPIIIRTFFKGQIFNWFLKDILSPMLPSLLTVLLLKYIIVPEIILYHELNIFILIVIGSLLFISSGIFYYPTLLATIFRLKKVQTNTI